MIEWGSYFCGILSLLFVQVCLAIYILKHNRKKKDPEKEKEIIKEILGEYDAKRSK